MNLLLFLFFFFFFFVGGGQISEERRRRLCGLSLIGSLVLSGTTQSGARCCCLKPSTTSRCATIFFAAFRSLAPCCGCFLSFEPPEEAATSIAVPLAAAGLLLLFAPLSDIRANTAPSRFTDCRRLAILSRNDRLACGARPPSAGCGATFPGDV